MADPAPSVSVPIGGLTVANDRPFTLIAGPCALESRAHALEMSAALKEITKLSGEVTVTPLGSLPNDGKVIADERHYE